MTSLAGVPARAARFATIGAALTANVFPARTVLASQTVGAAVRTAHTRVGAVIATILAGVATAIRLGGIGGLGDEIVLFKVFFQHNFRF